MNHPSWLHAVLFDLDGTLIDTESQIRVATVEVLSGVGRTVTSEQLQGIAGRTMEDWLRRELGMTAPEAQAVYRAYEAYAAAIASSAKPMPGAQSLINDLAACDVPMAIVTTRLIETASVALDGVGWSNHFPIVVAQRSTARPKPSPDPALFALQALGVPPTNAVMVGDTEADMTCASKAGLRMVVGVTSTRPASNLRDAGATHVCGDLAQVRRLLRDGSANASQGYLAEPATGLARRMHRHNGRY